MLKIRPATNEEIESVLKIDENTHTYYLDCPSVSDLKEEIWHFPREKIKPSVLQYAQWRGTQTHKALENYFNGKKVVFTKDIVKEYFNNCRNMFIKLFKNKELPGVKAEKSFIGVIETDKGKQIFTGTADLITSNKLIDWKTTSKANKQQEAFQLTCYCGGLGLDETELRIINGRLNKTYTFSEKAILTAREKVELAANKYIEKHRIWC